MQRYINTNIFTKYPQKIFKKLANFFNEMGLIGLLGFVEIVIDRE
jgi:hypothetical protein